MRRSVAASIASVACALSLAAGVAVAADTTPTYGVELEGFAYPHPLQRFAFESQGVALRMAYMDVAPRGVANGRTVVLLHGKNFCGATWEASIAALAGAGYRVVVPTRSASARRPSPSTTSTASSSSRAAPARC